MLSLRNKESVSTKMMNCTKCMEKLNNILLACCLGDGYLSSSGTFEILHTEKQKEYLEYKASLFNGIVKEKNNNGHKAYYFRKGVFNKRDQGKVIRKKLYGVMGHKYFSDDIVNYLDKFCIAILYCDDGSLIPQKSNGKISAYKCTISIYGSKSECERLQNKILELFGVKFNINKDKNKYLLKCGTREARKFIPQIKELIPHFKCFESNKLLDNF